VAAHPRTQGAKAKGEKAAGDGHGSPETLPETAGICKALMTIKLSTPENCRFHHDDGMYWFVSRIREAAAEKTTKQDLKSFSSWSWWSWW
jgi:hypothetical protein